MDWTPYALGFVPHFFCWAVIFCYFFQGVKQGNPPGKTFPSSMHAQFQGGDKSI